MWKHVTKFTAGHTVLILLNCHKVIQILCRNLCTKLFKSTTSEFKYLKCITTALQKQFLIHIALKCISRTYFSLYMKHYCCVNSILL